MNKLIPTLISSIALSLFASCAFASSTDVAETSMQHYVFTYHVNKHVDPIRYQYNETRQEINYVLALDIQRQVYRNLDAMAGMQDLYLDGLTAKAGKAVFRTHPLNNQLVAL